MTEFTAARALLFLPWLSLVGSRGQVGDSQVSLGRNTGADWPLQLADLEAA